MNIKQIRLVNFKNIKDSTITFKDNMSGIYGPNGTGKTAIIEAMKLLKKYFCYEPSIFFSFQSSPVNHSKYFNTLMMIGETTMSIEAILSDKKYDYKFLVTAQKDCDAHISIIEEKLSIKPSDTKRKFIDIASLENYDNSIIPNITLGKITIKENNLKAILKQGRLKQIISHYIAHHSMLDALHFQDLNTENTSFSAETKEFIYYFKQAKLKLNNVIALTLKSQSLYQGNLLIPIHCSFNAINTTINYAKNKNIYDSTECLCLKNTIYEISDLLSIIIPNSKLILEDKIIGYDEELGNSYAINLFVEKNKIKVPLYNESTGTIKLVSLLSVLVSYIRNKEVTVFIDELDVHIFEYLLGVLSEIITPLAKGQLIFTGHNLLPMEKLGKDSVIIATKLENNIVYEFMKGVSASTNIRQKYLKSQAFWSEDNIEPLMLNIPALELFIKKLALQL